MQFLVFSFLTFLNLDILTQFLIGERLDGQISFEARCTNFHMCVRTSHWEVLFLPKSPYYGYWLSCLGGKGYSHMQQFFYR